MAHDVPPLVSREALLDRTVSFYRQTTLLAVVVGGLTASVLAVANVQLLATVREQPILVVPGAADFVRVRLNAVPGSVARDFASDFAARLGNLHYLELERHFEWLALRMEPEVTSRLRAELENAATLVKESRIVEVWRERGESTLERSVNDAGDDVFVAVVRGLVERYSDGRRIGVREEVLRIQFRTSADLSGGSPHLFRVVDYRRMTEDEYKRLVRSEDL